MPSQIKLLPLNGVSRTVEVDLETLCKIKKSYQESSMPFDFVDIKNQRYHFSHDVFSKVEFPQEKLRDIFGFEYGEEETFKLRMQAAASRKKSA